MTIPLPEDFPRGAPAGSVSGVQAKLLARFVDGQYVAGWTEEELHERYTYCEDLAQQLIQYCQRKKGENPDWSNEFILQRMATAVTQKADSGVWDITSDELAWMLRRIKTALGW